MIDLAANAEKALRMTREAKVMAYDTETSGLDWRRNVPIGYVFTDEHESLYVPIRHGGGGNLADPTGGVSPLTVAEPEEWAIHPFEVELAKAFKERTEKNLVAIGHNMQFDCHSSMTAGIELGRNIACTQNTQTLCNEYTKGFTLEALGEYWKVQAKKGKEMYEHLGRLFDCAPTKDLLGRYWETSGVDEVAYDYAVGDGVTTLQVYHAQMKQVVKEDLEQIVALENSLIWTLVKMERRGIPVDVDYVRKLQQWLTMEVDRTMAEFPDGFNPRSPTQMQALMEEAGHTDWPLTPGGKPSFNADWLKTNPVGQKVVGMRQMIKLRDVDLTPIIEKHVYEGMVNPSIRQNASDDGGTVSGRLACAAPNMQAVSKHNKKIGPLLRRVYVAPPGYKMYEADYSQIEPRLYGHYSKDKALIEGYSQKPSKDVHTIVAEMMKVDRGTTGKRMNMGMFTGMQVKTFSSHMGLPFEEAADLWNRWVELFPGIPAFQNQARAVLADRGYVRTLLGRRGRLEKRQFAYKAASKIIQGNNADIIKYKLVEIDRWLEDNDIHNVWLFMSIHDSILWMAEDNEQGEAISAKITEMMVDVQSEPFNLRIPMEVEVDSGYNWADASYGAAVAADVYHPVETIE